MCRAWFVALYRHVCLYLCALNQCCCNILLFDSYLSLRVQYVREHREGTWDTSCVQLQSYNW